MKIAYFSPLPPARSGIADYSAMLLPALAQYCDLTLYTNQPENVSEAISSQFLVHSIEQFPGTLKAGVNICLYQMGNNTRYHQAIYHMMRRHPGVVTLHDINLHSFYGDLFLKTGLISDYCREMAFDYGEKGVGHARSGLRGKHAYDVQGYPLFGRVVAGNLGVIVHSQFAANQVQPLYPKANVRVIPIIQNSPQQNDLPSQAEAKERLDLSPDAVLLASFGYVAPNKRIDVVLRAFAALKERFSNLYLALVGQIVAGYDLQPLLNELSLTDKDVRLVGFADNDQFDDYLTATDIGINLRYPTLGESSATLLRLLALGKPVMVSNVDSFAELPETAVIKIDVGPNEQTQIETQITDLIENDSTRQTIGHHAAQLVCEQHAPDVVAQRYIEFLQEVTTVG